MISPLAKPRTTTAPSAGRLWAMLGIYVVTTIFATGLLIAAQSASGIDPAALSMTQFGPAIGALVGWLLCRRTVIGVLPPRVPSSQVRSDLGYLVPGCLVLSLSVVALLWLAGHDPLGPQAVGAVPFVVFLVMQLVGACGEEVGWRGLMQPALESRYRRRIAMLGTGSAWALWHVPAFTAGPVVAVSFFVSVLAFAALLGTLSNGSFWQRVSVATIGHWLINVGLYLGVGDDSKSQPQVYLIAIGAVVVAAAVLAIHRLRPRE